MSLSSASLEPLHIENVSKAFSLESGRLPVLSNINLRMPGGSFTSIVGSSGCGKSTLLRIIAGLEGEYDGSVLLGRERISGPGTNRGMVFQEHRLLPWLSVEENVALGLGQLSKEEREERVSEHLRLVRLLPFAKAFPNQLSGGMSQRVAIARSLVNKPDVLLMDEPFGALDAFTRIQMQDEILRIREHDRTTMILVTHDINEAVYLGDTIVIMSDRPGTIKESIAVDLPHPRNRNSPAFNQICGRIFSQFFSRADALEHQH